MRRKMTSWLSAVALTIVATTATTNAETVNWEQNIGSGETVTWYSTNTYVLSQFTYVLSNAVLKIEPGTVIKGSGGTEGTNSTTLGALIVTRGGKLMAEGTKEEPIIFTSVNDDVNDPDDLPLYTSGQWGGVTLLGNGVLNSSQDGAGGSATPIYDVYEGLEDLVIDGQYVHRFGGDDDNDSSGTLKYVSIRYSGFTFAGDKELNGLTMGGVGKGTTLEHVEVIGSSDDGFEWWGGCVNGKYLSAAFCEDDSFDFDQGYRGCLQFLFAIQKPTTADKIIETDGDLNNGNAADCENNEFPRTKYTIHNMTAIGSGITGGDTAVNSRDESGPNIFNSAFLESQNGMDIDSDGANAWVPPIGTCAYATMSNTVFQVVVFGVNGVEYNLLDGFNNTQISPEDPSPLVSVSRTNDGMLDPRPAEGSALLSDVLPQMSDETCSWQETTYRGAFSQSSVWLQGWSALDSLGVLAEGAPTAPELTITDNRDGTVTIDWSAGELYEAATADGPYNATGDTSGSKTVTTDGQAYYQAVVAQ